MTELKAMNLCNEVLNSVRKVKEFAAAGRKIFQGQGKFR